jgi:hypothetical protein
MSSTPPPGQQGLVSVAGISVHYTVYLIRFNKLILRSKIWNKSAPKRYAHNKLCTELIILKS